MTTTDAVTDHDIDPVEALRSLGYAETSPPEHITGGWETLIWRFQTPDGADLALRIYVVGPVEDIARREQHALTACAADGLPAPRLEATGAVNGLPAAVLSWCPGIPVLSIMEKKPWAIWRLSRLFGRTQARLHAVTPPAAFVDSAPDDWLLLAGDGYTDVIEHARTLSLSTAHLIHMDYHPLNVVSDGRAVTGVLDWARSAAGDPRADLARTEVTQIWAPIPPGPMKPLFEVLRKVMLRAWLSGYKEEAGSLPDFRPLRAWAGATLITEILPVLGNPGVWGTQEDVDRLRAMVERWTREAGIR